MEEYWVFELPLGGVPTDQDFTRAKNGIFHIWDCVTTGKLLFVFCAHQFPHLKNGVGTLKYVYKLWHSTLQNVEYNFPPFECLLDLVTFFVLNRIWQK